LSGHHIDRQPLSAPVWARSKSLFEHRGRAPPARPDACGGRSVGQRRMEGWRGWRWRPWMGLSVRRMKAIQPARWACFELSCFPWPFQLEQMGLRLSHRHDTLSLLQPPPSACDSQTSPPAPSERPLAEHHEVKLCCCQPTRQLRRLAVAASRITSCSICLKALSEACAARDAAGSIKDWDRSDFLSGVVPGFSLRAFLGLVSFNSLRACCGRWTCSQTEVEKNLGRSDAPTLEKCQPC